MDKMQEMLDRWCSAPDIQFKGLEAEGAYKKRANNCQMFDESERRI